MSARDELAELLEDTVPQFHEYADAFGEIADVLLAAGYSKPRRITTAEELDALPNEVLILTEQGGYWESIKRMDGLNWWKEPGAQGVSASSDLTLPATVLYAPKES